MRNLLIATAAGALTVTALPASAQDASAVRTRENNTSEQRTNDANEENTERRICVRVELSGSHVTRRICRTQREWDERGGLESER